MSALGACTDDSRTAVSTSTTSTTEPPRLVGPAAFTVWTVPDRSPEIDPDLVPHLLPADHDPGATVRYDGVEDKVLNTYEQTWLRVQPDDVVPAVVRLVTDLTGTQPPGPDAGWAIKLNEALGHVTLDAQGREVRINSKFFEPDELLELVDQLTLDRDGVGWSLPPSSPDERWYSLVEGWSGPFIGRSTQSYARILEISAQRNTPFTLGNLASYASGTLRVTEIDGSPALLIGRQGYEIVGWQADDGNVIIVAADDAVDVATTLEEVDRATWLAAAEPGPEQNLSTGCRTVIYDC